MLVRNRGTPHTDARDRRDFLALTLEQKIEEVWLDGRERNGHVADLLTDMAWVKPRVERHDRYVYVAITIVGMLVLAGPFIFFGLGQIW